MSVEIQSICRDAWFNCVVHGFSRGSDLARKYDTELRVIAKISPPLVADTRTSLLESDMELNTVLRRGMNAPNTIEHKRRLIELLPDHAKDIGSLTYPKVIFLETALLLESLRASGGDCSEVLTYFVDPLLKAGDTAGCMLTIANEVCLLSCKSTLAQADDFAGREYLFGQSQSGNTSRLFCCHGWKAAYQNFHEMLS